MQQYGEIQTLYTACGFVMISYYDIRASRRAMQALQNKLLGCTNLDIHYSIPKIRDGSRHKSIEFYDIRAAEAALHELNMGGKHMKLVPSKR
ncbi:putative RNA-binding domain superfamily [Helianthus annuus]|nr:putative RNA-binding domain superfamily [Helianthus annuus]KAJ0629846.1 putative RNA-binding domain superfamily [Helianthus annuus]